MASQQVASALAMIESSPNQQKPHLYRELLSRIASSPSTTGAPEHEIAHDLIFYLDSILNENNSIVIVRPLLDAFMDVLQQLSAESQIKIGQHAVTVIRSRSVEEQDARIREILADAYESQEEYVAAAKVLQGIHLDSSQRLISDSAKVKLWIRIVRLYLEEDDPTSAEGVLNRVKNLPNKIEDEELKVHFQLSQARILDARRRFLDASQEYYAISFVSKVDETDRLQALSAAMTCAILAPAGPLRSRMLGRLYKDERAQSTEEFAILEKMFLDRLLTLQEVKAFAEKLAPHQLALTADGSTVLDKAVIEHNLVAASKLYENLKVDSLGGILGLKDGEDVSAGEKAEAYAARMVEQGRLKGRIDQIEGIVYFDGSDSTDVNGSGASSKRIRQWDAGVQGVAEDVERVASSIVDKFPVCPLSSRLTMKYCC